MRPVRLAGMTRCSTCGASCAAQDRFCGACGSPLQLVCAGCGSTNPGGQRFCSQCGTALDAPAASRESAPDEAGAVPVRPVAERRLCSVLFADLVGFTTLSEARDPEDVREALSGYFSVCRSVIGRYGGVVEKFIGDAVMAVWGTPVATEQDAERAVRAALELVGAVEALGADVEATGLAARAGVVTGPVAVTIGAHGEGKVAGDAVNTASRVQGTARPGTVLVDDATRRLTERAVDYGDAGVHTLKGREAVEHLFVANRVLSGAGGSQRVDGLEAPLVGRAAELRAIKDLFHASAERRSPRLVVVSGPAGVGKSRLGWEFEKYTDGLADTVLWHRGRCLSYGAEGVAYWALAEIVRQRFGIAEEDPSDAAEAKMAEGMLRFVADASERDYIGARLSRLLGLRYPVESSVVLDRDELYAGWRMFFERLASIAPVAMLVEDAHHADEGLLGFFTHLIDWTRDLPIFVLLFARPGLDAIDSGYGVGRNRSTLSLDPLDPVSMAELVEALVPGIPIAARDTITTRAEGIPLFAVETIRALADYGVVQRDEDGHHRLVGTLGADMAVPHTLHSLLAARLDALPPTVRALVGVASVLGHRFPKEALVAVSGEQADAVYQVLDELVRRDVLSIAADPLSPERGSYRFRQELLRQVAYETLSRRDRKAHHLAVAAHLRQAFANDGEEIAEVVARHYQAAAAASPGASDAAALSAEGRLFLLRAAERAERSGAPASAAELFAEAAGIAAPDERGALLERAAQASYAFGDMDRSLEYVDRAHEASCAVGDERGAARARSLRGRILQYQGRSAAARRELTEAVAVLRPEPDADTVEALRRLATVEIFAGNLGQGEALVDEALRLAQEIDAGPGHVGRLLDAKGHAAVFGNRHAEAAVYYEAAARIGERTGNLATMVVAQHNLADILARTDPTRAAEVARSAAQHARRTGRRSSLGLAVANLAIALLEVGEWDAADAVLREARDVDHLDDEDSHRATAWLAGLRGDTAGAMASLEHLAGIRDNEEPQTQASVEFLEALVALGTGNLGLALAHARSTLAKQTAISIGHESQRWGWPLAARVARELGDADIIADLMAMLDAHPIGHLPPVLRAERQLVAALAAADRQSPHALASVERAVGALRGVGNPYQLAHALIDYAGVLNGAGHPGWDLAVGEARAIAGRLRCPALVARADLLGVGRGAFGV